MDKSAFLSRQAFLRLLVWVSLALLVLLPVASLGAQSMATIKPDPVAMELALGQVQTVEIVLENAQNVYGIDVRASFDPARVEIIDADPAKEGTQLIPGAFPAPDFVALNTADNAAGTLRYVVTQVNPTSPATGSGIVFSFQLRARSAGQSALALMLVEMADRDGLLLAVTPASATITVAGSGPAAPTGIILQTAEPAGNRSPTATTMSATPTTENSFPAGSTTTPIAQVTNVALATGTPQPTVVAAALSPTTSDAPTVSESAATAGPVAPAVATTESATESASTPAGESTRMTGAEDIVAGPTAAFTPPTELQQRTVIGESARQPAAADDVVTTSDATVNRALMPIIIAFIIAMAILVAVIVLWARRRQGH